MAAPLLLSAPTYPADYTAPEHLHAIVDIGSNGVRFSITTLHPATARTLPTLYSDRAAISLYDAQFQYSTLSQSHINSPIPAHTIQDIIHTLLRFRSICDSYSVLPSNIKLIATEATRTAPNSLQFRQDIEKATGWTVTLLPKDQEGSIGALGIASSFTSVEGLVMDLGGGSTQLSYMLSKRGHLETAKEAISLPFGAAALTKKLQTAITTTAVDATGAHIREELTKAVETLSLPPELNKKVQEGGEGVTLYLSGGGFRGFGYLLMAEHEVSPYPIPIINGFSVPREKFTTLASKIGVELSPTQREELGGRFRISDRRSGQVPAVAFLIRNLMQCLPLIKEVVFCQGGVREGWLYNTLPESVRAGIPLVVATEVYSPPGAKEVTRVINDALPKSTPDVFWMEIVPALANVMYFHGGMGKEARAASGLHFTTTGALGGSVHGLTHAERALLGLVLCARWGGEVAESSFKDRLERVVGEEMAWWARYVGAVAHAIGAIFPVGISISSLTSQDGDGCVSPVSSSGSGSEDGNGSRRRRRKSEVDGKVSFFARDVARKEHLDIVLRVRVMKDDPDTSAVMVKKAVEDIEKVGKKKNCKGFRRKVSVIWETAE
ncbi:hypothetical protein TWF694_006516 [Orbilia ellipsospora]|uniref:Ppx/GppA phosphatase domain-containing protein n=1 Tax=Orbilia ellipsospora TaxID=2528407 RepID=A0AAV9XS28_9PEZI